MRSLIDKETQKDGVSLETASAEMTDKISLVQRKLNKLTQGYLDELIDEESYQAAKTSLVLEKIQLKSEKSSFTEPAPVFGTNQPKAS